MYNKCIFKIKQLINTYTLMNAYKERVILPPLFHKAELRKVLGSAHPPPNGVLLQVIHVEECAGKCRLRACAHELGPPDMPPPPEPEPPPPEPPPPEPERPSRSRRGGAMADDDSFAQSHADGA